jgi:carbonic anhydrase/acetyltransferase-like protein (isoleucine patch superfamily)
MWIAHAGKLPQIAPSAWVAPDATVCGDVTIGPGARILYGARVIGEGGGRIRIEANCIIMENAVVRAGNRHPCTISDHSLTGPNRMLWALFSDGRGGGRGGDRRKVP